MQSKRISALLVMAIILVISGITSYNIISNKYNLSKYQNVSSVKEFFTVTEELISKTIPFSNSLRSFAVNTRYNIGQREQDNIFITDKYLLENIAPPIESISNSNTAFIINYAQTYRIPTYLMLIPTSCAINQQELNVLEASQLYNQKAYIENVYRSLDGRVSSVSVYPTLFANKDKNLYYKTEANLTSTGGYYIYQTLGGRLNLNTHAINRYEIEHLSKEFYGSIYDRSPYKDIEPDQISLYHFTRFKREYIINRITDKGINTYYTLFPKEAAVYNDTNVFLGGDAHMIEIISTATSQNKLLIYGDETAQAYMPFLAPHYSNITFLNAQTASDELLDSIDIKAYDQVVFAFSVDNYMRKEVLF